MRSLAYFTETMRKVYFRKEEGMDKAVKALKNFLKQISPSDLEEITQESENGAVLVALKTTPGLVEGFIRSLDTTSIGFREWISSYSRSWALLN